MQTRHYAALTCFAAMGCAIDTSDATDVTLEQSLTQEGVGDVDPANAQPAAPALGPSQNAPLEIWVAHGGNDSAAGDQAHPLATLGAAQTLLEKNYPSGLNRNVEVRVVADGKAYQEVIEWTYSSPDYTISIMPSNFQFGMRWTALTKKGGRPIFDGRNVCSAKKAGSYCRFFHGQVANMRFYYLDVRHYSTAAISLHDSTGHNLVYGCVLSSIGTQPSYFHSLAFGMSGVSFSSDHNRVQNNHFVDLINKAGDERFLHAVYMNTGSDNTIVYNSALRVCGDPIKVRNFANGNVIEHNRFRESGGKGFFLDWPESGESCSWMNVFAHNVLESGYNGASMSATSVRQGCNKCNGAECKECQNGGCSDRVKVFGNAGP